jgi:hypothetical protein
MHFNHKFCKFLSLGVYEPTRGYSHFLEASYVANISVEHSASVIWVEMRRASECTCYIGWQSNRPRVERGLLPSPGHRVE